MNNSQEKLNRSIRWILTFFIVGLVLSGLTALPIEWQLQLALDQMKDLDGDLWLPQWLEFVYKGVKETNNKYPFISYGTDWLAFAHFVIALVFIGPWRNPVKNIWVIEFGIIACVLILPFSFIAGAARGIPLYWRMIDCSFGIFGGLLLWSCYNKVMRLQKIV